MRLFSPRDSERLIRVTSMSADFAVLEAEARKVGWFGEKRTAYSSAACRSGRSRSRAAACISVSGRRVAARSRSRSMVRVRSRWKAEADGYYSGLVAEARPGMRYGFRTDTRGEAAARPGLALSAGGAARAVGNRRSRKRSAGPTRLWRGRQARGTGHLRDACRQFHTRGHLSGGRARSARTGRARRHLHRADAGRRFPGTFRVGL